MTSGRLTLHAPGEVVTGPSDGPVTLGAVAVSLQALAATLEAHTPEARAALERMILALGEAASASDTLHRLARAKTPNPKGK